MNGAALVFDRWAVAAAVVLTCASFTFSAADPVNVVKLTVLLLVALGLVVSATVRTAQRRELVVPVSPAGVTGALLAVAFVVAAVTAPVGTTAVLGTYGRNSGLLAYLAALLLYFVALRALGGPRTLVVLGGVVIAALFTAGYGLVQHLGWDPVTWNQPFNPIIGTLGNPNFASGYLGIAGTVAAGGALCSSWSLGWRITAAATTCLSVVAAALSGSVQGPIAFAAGLSVVAAAWLLDRPGRTRAVGLAALGTAVLAGLALLLAGLLAKAGPAAPLFTDIGSRARAYYWQAALSMFGDAPVLGVGLDHYGYYWRAARSPESLATLAGNDFSDAAHSVPLQMLAQGGLVLGTAYSAFVLVTGFIAARGLLRARGEQRMLLAAVAGGWAAYQVQSFVSIDQVPLLVLHFTLAGAVVATAGAAGHRVLRLAGASVPRPVSPNDAGARRRSKAAGVVVRERELDAADRAVVAVVGALALVGAYYALTPLRADVAVRSGDLQSELGRGDASLARYERATELVPGQAAYWLRIADLYDRAAPPQPEPALTAYEAAVSADPLSLNARLGLAQATERVGDVERSRELYRRVLEMTPYDDAVLVVVAGFELRQGEAERARGLLEDATRRLPPSAAVWTQLGAVRTALGDPVAAREAYERALAIEPEHARAKEALASLPA